MKSMYITQVQAHQPVSFFNHVWFRDIKPSMGSVGVGVD